MVRHAITLDTVEGPYNATAPNPVTNAGFTDVLAHTVRRRALLRIPRFGPRLLVGGLADELLYASLRAVPERIVASGYALRHTELAPTLRELLARADG